MSAQLLTLILHFVLAIAYLALLVTLFKRHVGQEMAATILSVYVVTALLLELGEGFWRGGQLYIASRQIADDFQAYGALLLSIILTLVVVSFIRRDISTWLGVGFFWLLGFVAIFPNIFRFGDVIWQSGSFALTRERLAPTHPEKPCRCPD